MKKFRFISVAVALVAVLVVSVWAGSTTHNTPILNGIVAVGQKTGITSLSCRTLTGPSTSYLTSVTIKRKGPVTFNCSPTTQCRIILYHLEGANYTEIGSLAMPCGSNFSSGLTITLPANTYPANGTYCFAGEVTLLNPATGLCGFSLNSWEVIFNWSP